MKKAQLEGMEQIMIIFIVIVIGLVFLAIFLRLSAGKSRGISAEELEKSAVDIATIVSAMPELQCTKNNVITTNCINILKAEILIDSNFIEENKAYYHSIFGFSKISIKQNYPQEIPDLVIYANIPQDKRKHRIVISLPRMIYDPRENGNCFALGKGTCNFGNINIEMFER
ncbi:MAG: hypothetical protein AABY14_03075 [Nanoarchaeota archaeon]